ncbi:MAG TPA: hypothetical protein VH475_02260 [Tepidisphaeraceae bacterium]|jgi:hypothetical protein
MIERVYQYLFDRADGPVAKVGACTFIDALAFAVFDIEESGRMGMPMWLCVAAGAGLGFIASVALVARDRLANPALRKLLMAFVVLVAGLAGAMIVSLSIVDKR